MNEINIQHTEQMMSDHHLARQVLNKNQAEQFKRFQNQDITTEQFQTYRREQRIKMMLLEVFSVQL